MANQVPACQGCEYNTPKTKGGFGRICNGYTQAQFGRCPEWRKNELCRALLERERCAAQMSS